MKQAVRVHQGCKPRLVEKRLEIHTISLSTGDRCVVLSGKHQHSSDESSIWGKDRFSGEAPRARCFSDVKINPTHTMAYSQQINKVIEAPIPPGKFDTPFPSRRIIPNRSDWPCLLKTKKLSMHTARFHRSSGMALTVWAIQILLGREIQ